MVGVAGRSKGCNTCKARKIACGLQRPQCAQCVKSNRLCAGYQRQPVFIVNQGKGLKGYKTTNRTEDDDKARNQLPHRTKFNLANPAMPFDHRKAEWSQELFLRKQSLYTISSNSAYRQQLYALFISCFLPIAHVGSMPKKPWILQIADIGNPTEALQEASLAFCLARVGNFNNDSLLRRESLKVYTRSLYALQKALLDRDLLYSDETLAAVQLLSFYELFECPDHNTSGYVSHNKGTARLIQLRGPEAHATGLGHSLFLAYRGPGLLQVMEDQTLSFLSTPEWCTIPWKYTPKTALDRIWDLLALAPAIFNKAKGFENMDPITRLRTALEVIESMWEIETAQAKFFIELEESIPGPMYWPELSVLNNPADGFDQGKMFPVAFHFCNLRVANTVMTYWSAQVMAWNGLSQLYMLVATTEVDLRTIHNQGIKFPYDGFKPCHKDCPCKQETRFPCFTHFDLNELPPLGHRANIVTPARNILQSVEYCLQDEMLDAGPAQACAPLNIVIDTFKEHPKHSKYVRWGKAALQMIQKRCMRYLQVYIDRIPDM